MLCSSSCRFLAPAANATATADSGSRFLGRHKSWLRPVLVLADSRVLCHLSEDERAEAELSESGLESGCSARVWPVLLCSQRMTGAAGGLGLRLRPARSPASSRPELLLLLLPLLLLLLLLSLA